MSRISAKHKANLIAQARATEPTRYDNGRSIWIIGDHTVLYAGTGERIEITHKSSSRATYAQGSLRAVRFLADRKTGMFDMFDVLGLR